MPPRVTFDDGPKVVIIPASVALNAQKVADFAASVANSAGMSSRRRSLMFVVSGEAPIDLMSVLMAGTDALDRVASNLAAAAILTRFLEGVTNTLHFDEREALCFDTPSILVAPAGVGMDTPAAVDVLDRWLVSSFIDLTHPPPPPLPSGPWALRCSTLGRLLRGCFSELSQHEVSGAWVRDKWRRLGKIVHDTLKAWALQAPTPTFLAALLDGYFVPLAAEFSGHGIMELKALLNHTMRSYAEWDALVFSSPLNIPSLIDDRVISGIIAVESSLGIISIAGHCYAAMWMKTMDAFLVPRDSSSETSHNHQHLPDAKGLAQMISLVGRLSGKFSIGDVLRRRLVAYTLEFLSAVPQQPQAITETLQSAHAMLPADVECWVDRMMTRAEQELIVGRLGPVSLAFVAMPEPSTAAPWATHWVAIRQRLNLLRVVSLLQSIGPTGEPFPTAQVLREGRLSVDKQWVCDLMASSAALVSKQPPVLLSLTLDAQATQEDIQGLEVLPLEELNLRGCKGITDLRAFAQCRTLRNVDVCSSGVTPEGIRGLQVLPLWVHYRTDNVTTAVGPSTEVVDIGVECVPDKCATNCTKCERKFNILLSKKHCFSCGLPFCSYCAEESSSMKFEVLFESRLEESDLVRTRSTSRKRAASPQTRNPRAASPQARYLVEADVITGPRVGRSRNDSISLRSYRQSMETISSSCRTRSCRSCLDCPRWVRPYTMAVLDSSKGDDDNDHPLRRMKAAAPYDPVSYLAKGSSSSMATIPFQVVMSARGKTETLNRNEFLAAMYPNPNAVFSGPSSQEAGGGRSSLRKPSPPTVYRHDAGYRCFAEETLCRGIISLIGAWESVDDDVHCRPNGPVCSEHASSREEE